MAELRRALGLAWVKDVSAVDSSGIEVATAHRPDANVRTRGLTDAQIRAVIGDLGSYWPTLLNAGVQVDVVGGVATLRGTVPTVSDSRAAEEMARSAVDFPARDEPAKARPLLPSSTQVNMSFLATSSIVVESRYPFRLAIGCLV